MKHSLAEAPKNNREAPQDTVECGTLHELQGTSFVINPDKPEQDTTPTVGWLHTGSSMFEGLPATDPTQYAIIDMRSAPRNPENNWPVYDGFDWPEHTEYLVLQPSSYAQNKFRGYAALHIGKKVTLGRNNDHFDSNSVVSRNHVVVEASDEGLRVTDLDSTNGTSLMEYKQDEKTTHKPRRVGDKALHAVAQNGEVVGTSEFTTDEEAVIAANIGFMLSKNYGLGHALASESMGGNAGTIKIEGKSYVQGAANAYVEMSGKIIKFSNYPTDKPIDRPALEIAYVAAIPRVEFVNGTVKTHRPESWVRDTHITKTYINHESIESGVEKGWITERTAKIMEETARRYNLVPSTR